MATFTGQLGVENSILGANLALGFAEDLDPLNQTVFQSLGFNATAVFDPIITITTSNAMLSDTAEALFRAVSQSLFSVNVANPDATIDVTQFLGFTDRKIFDIGNIILARIGNPSRAAEAVLATTSNFVFANASSNKIDRAHKATDLFGFVNVIAAATFTDTSNIFVFDEVVASVGVSDRAPSNTGFMKQSVSFSIDDDSCREKEYDPLIGESDDDSFDPFTTTPPIITPTTTGITLTFPLTSPTSTLLLEIPNFGNDDILNFTRIDRTTRGNDRKIFSDPKWAKFERLTFTMSGNTAECTAGIDEIIDFLNISLMKEIGLTDWEGRTWAGFIVAPDTEVSETPQGFQLQLVFEGVLT